MTFDMIRLGWPNTAAILGLAIMPIVALTMPTQPPVSVQAEQIEAAAICRTPTGCAMIAVAVTPETVME